MTVRDVDADLLAWLAPGECTACRRAQHAAERFVFFFVYEGYADFRTRDALRASLGFCPAHMRLLLERTEAPWVMRAACEEAVDGALARLTSAPHAEVDIAPCPMCSSIARSVDTHIRALAEALSRPGARDAYSESGGLCVPHAIRAWHWTTPDAAAIVSRTLERRLVDGPSMQVRDCMAGVDADADSRCRFLQAIAAGAATLTSAGPAAPILTILRERLRSVSCPVCFAGGAMEMRYLAWVCARHAADSLDCFADHVWLCAEHLHDLDRLDAGAGAAVIAYQSSMVRGELVTLWHRLEADVPPPTARGRLIAAGSALASAEAPRKRRRRALMLLFGSRTRAARRALAPIRRSRPCSACDARDTAAARQLDLLRAALRDEGTREVYAGAHGLCARHVLSLPPDRRPSAVVDVLDARLRIAQWELAEALRKAMWSSRHEAHGDEDTAWRRAPALVDGRCRCGVPSPVTADGAG